MNINEVSIKIKQVGATNVRAVPMPKADVRSGQYKIEINDNGNWVPILEGIPSKKSADDLIAQATNRVICG